MSPRAPPSSVGASDLGRLALGRSSGASRRMVSKMGVTTRSGAKREEEAAAAATAAAASASKGESSRGSAAKGDKGKGKGRGSTTMVTRRSGKASPAAARKDPDDDDGDDDDDDGDDDEDDDDDEEDDDDDDDGDDGESNDEGERGPAAWGVRQRVMAIHLIYEPSQHSLSEFMREDLPERSEHRQVITCL